MQAFYVSKIITYESLHAEIMFLFQINMTVKFCRNKMNVLCLDEKIINQKKLSNLYLFAQYVVL